MCTTGTLTLREVKAKEREERGRREESKRNEGENDKEGKQEEAKKAEGANDKRGKGVSPLGIHRNAWGRRCSRLRLSVCPRIRNG